MLHSRKRRKGFTILELIIVLVIIGFFAAVIVPKLGRVGEDADKTVGAYNKKEIQKFTRIWQQEHNGLPNKLINLVNQRETDFAIPEVDDTDPETGPETLKGAFIRRLKPYLHTLNAAEAAELQEKGITYVMTLNDTQGSDNTVFHDTDGTPMFRDDVEAGVTVLMAGAGHNGTAWVQGISNGFSTYSADTGLSADFDGDGAGPGNTGYDHGHPEWMYRIILGVGPDCSLVADGTAEDAPLSPIAMKDEENVTYKYYCLVLPRLKETVQRLKADNLPELIDIHGDAGEEKQVDIVQEQEIWSFDVVDPSGEGWPAPKNDMWHIESATP